MFRLFSGQFLVSGFIYWTVLGFRFYLLDGSRFPVYLMNSFWFSVSSKWFLLNGKNSIVEPRKLFTRLKRITVDDVIVFRLPLSLWSEVRGPAVLCRLIGSTGARFGIPEPE